MLNAADLERLRRNIFPAAHSAIEDWATFPWHRGSGQLHSSQALAIDVFGTLAVHPDRDALVGALVRAAFPNIAWHSTSWTVELEACVRALAEPRPTQLDAMLVGDAELVVVESKFCESTAGPCSQPNPRTSGRHKGLRQCNGSYAHQINPISGVEARCALTAKGIKYWDLIPEMFDLRADLDHDGPCFFADGKFQLMRNVVAASALARANAPPKAAATLLVFTDGPRFPMALEIRDPTSSWNRLLDALHPATRPRVRAFSYQSLLATLTATLPDNSDLAALSAWVQQRKLPAGTAARSVCT